MSDSSKKASDESESTSEGTPTPAPTNSTSLHTPIPTPASLRPLQLFGLYGDSITVELPATFANISNATNAEDYQEVLIDAGNDTSVIVELLAALPDEVLQEADDYAKGTASMTHYLSRLTGPGEDFFNNEVVNVPYPLGDVEEVTNYIREDFVVLKVSMVVKKPTEDPTTLRSTPDYTLLHLLLIRFTFEEAPERNTDILITVSTKFWRADRTPRSDPEGGDFGGSEKSTIGAEVRENIVETFRVIRDELFSNQEDTSDEDND